MKALTSKRVSISASVYPETITVLDKMVDHRNHAFRFSKIDKESRGTMIEFALKQTWPKEFA